MTRLLLVLFILSLSNLSYALDKQVLRIHGSNTVGASLAPELVKSWLNSKGLNIISDKVTAPEERLIVAKSSTQYIEIEIHAHGSSTSFKDFAIGKTDVGISSRPIKDKEVEKLSFIGDLRSKHSEYVIALDGLPIIVHPSNPITKLDIATIQKIFSGKITHWSQLGFKNGINKGRINLYARDDKSGTYDTFKSLVLGKEAPLSKKAQRFESNAKLSDSVASDPNGIGFVGLAYVRNAKVLAISDEGTQAIKPAAFSVATEDYALARRLYIYIPEKGSSILAREFAGFAVSPAADKIVSKVGFVSQELNGYKLAVSKQAPKEYRKLTQDAERLSLNIRFNSGSVILDNKAVRNIARLSVYLSKPENKKRKLMLFGFTDKHEVAPYVSLSVSIQRADIVADYLLRNHIAPAKVRGYGDQLAVATNLTQHGKNKNRRVEVWLQ